MIKGITPSLAEGGKIKIGTLGEEKTAKSGRKYRVPVKFDNFLLTQTHRDQDGRFAIDKKLMDDLTDAGYADDDGKIRTLPIILHSDDIDSVFPTAYARYDGRKLACRGDGETAISNGKEIKCTCPLLEQGKCKPHGTLHASINLQGNAVAGMVHKWRTTSIISVQQMLGSLIQIKQLVGVLRGAPLTMRVRLVEATPNGVATKVPVCHIELRASDVIDVQRDLLESARERREVLAELDDTTVQDYRALVQAPGVNESPEDEADIQQEFHPEKMAQLALTDGKEDMRSAAEQMAAKHSESKQGLIDAARKNAETKS